MQSQDSHSGGALDSPGKSVFGFTPGLGTSATPGAQQLRTQKSLLADLLAAAYSSAGHEDDEEFDETEDGEEAPCASPPAYRPVLCSCGVGQGVPGRYHATLCPLHYVTESSVQAQETVGIDIPNKTYFKRASQILERERLQYSRCLLKRREAAANILAP